MHDPAIAWESVSFRYADAGSDVLSTVDVDVPEGELCLVVGNTGSGKSTLLRTINGAVPHSTGGTLHGRVLTAGRDTADFPPRQLADVVGAVQQRPADAFIADSVEEEIAYGMECLGIAPDVMRRRVEEILDLLGLAEIRDRPLSTLSGGQQQRVALAGAFAPHPRVLVLDEPTSALDPTAAEEVLAAVQRLVHDLGTTVLMAEHRLERVAQYADSVILVPGPGRRARYGDPTTILTESPVAPPVVELARLLGFSPIPLSIRDARRAVSGHPLRQATAPERPRPAPGEEVLRVDRLVATHGPIPALRGIDLRTAIGEVVAVMGRNGAGKSTLLSCIAGLHRPQSGSVTVDGLDPRRARRAQIAGRVGLVPAEPGDLLLSDRVERECAEADRDAGAAAGHTAALLDQLLPGIAPAAHPRDLSSGQRLALALAVVLARSPRLILLDEPTRGLDYPAKRRAGQMLRRLAAGGHAVLLVTHDVELAAATADRVVMMAEGEIIADAPAPDALSASPAFAPQVAKVLAPARFLTVDDVAATLKPA